MQHYRNCYIDNNHSYGVKTTLLSNKIKIEGMSLHFPFCDVRFYGLRVSCVYLENLASIFELLILMFIVKSVFTYLHHPLRSVQLTTFHEFEQYFIIRTQFYFSILIIFTLYPQVERYGGASVSLYLCAFKTGTGNKRVRTMYVVTKNILDSSTFSIAKNLMMLIL